MEFLFEREVAAPREGVFAFHADPGNLEVLMRRCAGFRVLRHDRSIRPGAVTWVEQPVFPWLKVVMGFRHTLCEPPLRFGEEIFHGPFSRFVHLHEFEERPGGRKVITAIY